MANPDDDDPQEAFPVPQPTPADFESDVVQLHTDKESDPPGVARIVLDDPNRRNALSTSVAAGLVDALRALEGTRTRCVVIEGRGNAFCAGGDIDAMRELYVQDAALSGAVRHVIQSTARCIQRTAECAFPTVARIHGPAHGAGASLALACDIQLAHEDAEMGFGFRNLGLAVDSGVSYFLPRYVADNVARELVFTGETVSATRAKELGLVNHVYTDDEFDAAVNELVREIGTGPSIALQTSKRLLRAGGQSGLHETIEREAEAQAAVLDSRDHAEGVEAFLERREPNFDGQ